jgi:hypothetical protein
MESRMNDFVQSTFFDGVHPILQRRQRERINQTENYNFVIEKNVPIVRVKHAKSYKYPFSKMAVGDSFSFPKGMQNRVSSAATYYGKITKRKFTIRKNGNGTCRCWRIK